MIHLSPARIAATFACATLLLVTTAHATQAIVEGNTITSREFPVGSITIDSKFSYVGTTEFVLYNVANCEIVLFAELAGKRVKRYYWLQFEGYLPDAKQTYNYSRDPKSTMIGGHAFHERASFLNLDETRARMRPGSDSAAVRKLFEDKGYDIGPEVMLLRMVRLDETARKELMIIYSENLEPQGLKVADIAEGGKAFAQRDALIDGLRERAVAGIRMTMR